MSQLSKIALLKEMLESAEASLRSAKQILAELGGVDLKTANGIKYQEKAAELEPSSKEAQGKIVEGVFDGQNMIGPDKRSYPVQANYASKSKLIPGDVLKLTISENGSFIYKQIGPVPRRQAIGTLAYADGQYKVMAEGKVYKVLLASVTYYKAEVGDQVTVIVPELEDSEWASIENVLPPSGEPSKAGKQTELDIDLEEELE
ncbi:MAG: hypothetical protein PHU71_00465 [Candidatus Gracilibacteria bacterium]|nr:hypothetical protein [Candidatus Gracilibacteria bacterium]